MEAGELGAIHGINGCVYVLKYLIFSKKMPNLLTKSVNTTPNCL